MSTCITIVSSIINATTILLLLLLLPTTTTAIAIAIAIAIIMNILEKLVKILMATDRKFMLKQQPNFSNMDCNSICV